MKKHYRIALFIFSFGLTSAYAQVGMTTNNPNKDAVLDLNNTDGTNNKGLLLPKVALTATNQASPLTAHVAGMKVYNTVTAGSGVTKVIPGEYYNDGSKWVLLNNGWGLTGNGSTDATVNFIGTTDSKALKFRINNEPAGLLSNGSTGGNYTGLGYNSLTDPQSGSSYGSTALGINCLGGTALAGNYNVAIGNDVMSQNNFAGTNNLGVGNMALYKNTTGSYNVAVGESALKSVTTASYNTAIGREAIGSSTAVFTGSQNLAIGNKTLYSLTTGNYNAAIGAQALTAATTGGYNIALGTNAGNTTTTGNYNILIGGSATNAITASSATASNELNIGNTLFATGINNAESTYTGKIGVNTRTPTANLSVNGTANNTSGAWGVFSDSRIKTVDGKFTDGLNIIMKINPVKFHYNNNAPNTSDKEQIGIVAQDLEKIAPYMVNKKDYQGDSETGKPGIKDLREVNNQAYVFLLINAVKEQQKLIDDLRYDVDQLKKTKK